MTVKLSGVIHARPVDIGGEVPRFSDKGGLTLAYAVHGNGDVSLALATCSDEDSFNRKLGSKIATGRLATPGRGGMTTVESTALEFFAEEVFGDSRKIKPILATGGEYYVPTSDFPLVAVLLAGTRDVVQELVMRSLKRQGYFLGEPVDTSWIHFSRINGKYGFCVTPVADKVPGDLII